MTRDRFASQRGIGMVVVVIMVVIAIILAVTSLLLYARMQHLQVTQKEMQQTLKNEQARYAATARNIADQLTATGLRAQEDPQELPTSRDDDELKKRSDVLFEPMPEKLAYVTEPNRAPLEALEKRIAQVRKDHNIYPTLQELLQVAAMRLLYVRNLNEQLTLHKTIAENHAKAVADMKAPVTQRKIDYKAHLTTLIQGVNGEIQKEDEKFTGRQAELTKARDDAAAGIETENARYYDWEIRNKNETRKLQDELERLKIQEAIKYEVSTVHGRVLRPDAPNKMGFIDIGSRDRVVPGLKFLACKRGDQGKLVYKGELEVKKVWPTYAEVSIVKVFDREMPVIEGDLIVNPLFHTRRPVLVAFAGEDVAGKLRQPWTPSVNEATRRIREIGSEVRTAVTPEIDFVIFTEASAQKQHPSAYPNFVKAVTLGIPYEEAAEIFRFLGD